ncbi:MAG: ATP-binding protein [Chloroflexi bacterium]|nr:ATP-binding protein [Chloroflexota bacterium]
MERAGETLKKIAANTSTTSTSDASRQPDQIGPGDPNCPHCHGIGYVREDVPVGHPNFGRLFACSCRVEEIAAAQKHREHQLSSLGPLAGKTFENFKAEGHAVDALQRASLRRAYDQTRQYAESPRGWLLLHGGYGCGKTHLAAAIANARLAQGQPVMFINAPDLIDHLRATFAPSSEISYDDLFERIRNIPLLIVDDLGAESPTPWAQEKLYQIFNHRYNAALPTVVTSNVELERVDPRLRSRLVDMDLVRKIVIDAPDFRRADSDQTDLSSLEHHRRQTFESFDDRKGELAGDHFRLLHSAFEEAQQFAEDPHGWLVFTGPHGSGKTHLAAAIANHRVRAGQPALFITFADLLDHLRATFSPESTVRYDKRFAELKSAPLLVLDDLALESATPWTKEKLMQLIDYRYVAALPTVVTTSADRAELDDRLQTRLLDPRLSVVCPITAPIYRGGKSSPKKRSNKPRAR